MVICRKENDDQPPILVGVHFHTNPKMAMRTMSHEPWCPKYLKNSWLMDGCSPGISSLRVSVPDLMQKSQKIP